MRNFYVRVKPDADAPWAGMMWKEGGGFTLDRAEAMVIDVEQARNSTDIARVLELGLVRLVPVKEA